MSKINVRSFSHLNVHSHYTLMGSTASIPGLLEKASNEDLRWLALTDTHALYGVIEFKRACEKAGIQALIGMSLQVAPPIDLPGALHGRWGKLVLIARNRAGYTSLCRLSSAIQLGATDPALEAVPWSLLADNFEGLLAIEGGRLGWLESLIAGGAAREAAEYLARFTGLFQDSCFIGFERQPGSNDETSGEVLGLADRFGVPAIPLIPVYCLEAEERDRLRLLGAIQQNMHLQELPRECIPGSDDPHVTVHWLNLAEMAERYAPYASSLAETAVVQRACQAQVLPSGSPIWPALELPQDQTPIEALRRQALEGLRSLYPHNQLEQAHERLEHELQLIEVGGYAPLFLIVADIARHAREVGIPMNTRGSVANSLVAYAIAITNVDPLEHELLFERFLNPARSDLPDIDLDFCSRRRDELLDYLRETYGEDQVAMVATIQTMQPRSAVRETAKAYGYAEAEIKRITGGISSWRHPDPDRRGRSGIATALEQAHEPLDREILAAAQGLVGQPRHLSVHPGGVVLTPGPLTDVVPVQPAPKGILITQFAHEDIEAIGLPKVDLLGIRALSVIARAHELIQEEIQPDFDPGSNIEHDATTGDLLEHGETIGVFQCESEGAQNTLRKLRARTVKDLAVANAFFKPGPATGGMAGAFVRRYRGEESVSFLHPSLEPILRSTQGVLLFQEQILQVATGIAGLSWEDANQLRRGISKFRAADMEALRDRFIRGCMQPSPGGPGFTATQAQTMWEQVHAFAGYGFNKGHATAYAGVSYRMAYLKGHYPEAFLCARLSEHGGYHHPAVYIAEARRLRIAVRPPHINHSRRRFHLAYEGPGGREQPVLWMGLDQVRDLRKKAIHQLQAARAEGPFESLRALTRRVSLQDRELAHLVRCGALDGVVAHRQQGLAEIESLEITDENMQERFDFMDGADEAVEMETLQERLGWERQLLGMPVSVHPLQLLPATPEDSIPLGQVSRHPGQRVVTHGARLAGWVRRRTYFISDPQDFLRVKVPEERDIPLPETWAPLRVEGSWREDTWGGGWLEVARIEAISQA